MYNKSQLTQTDPRDALRHARSTIALQTQCDAECDQYATVVGRLLTTLCHITVAKCREQSTDERSLVYGT